MNTIFSQFHSRLLASALLLAFLVSVRFAPVTFAGVVIHTPQDILAEQTVSSGGKMFFQDADGKVWEFITDIEDPSISNPGAGGFFPAEESAVLDAVRAIAYPVKALNVEIFLLPYPRRGLLRSSATNGAIYVSPGVVPYPETQLHSLVAHEMGHVVHSNYADDSNIEFWDTYRSMRGIEDRAIYNHEAQHKDRPHEVFAEDFRFLFGGDLANYAGGIENGTLELPSRILGLKQFMMGLAGPASTGYDVYTPTRLQFSPNPTFGSATVLAREAGIATSLPSDLFVYDVRGRRVLARRGITSAALSWDGDTDDGSRAVPGIYFVEIRQASKRWVGKLVLAR